MVKWLKSTILGLFQKMTQNGENWKNRKWLSWKRKRRLFWNTRKKLKSTISKSWLKRSRILTQSGPKSLKWRSHSFEQLSSSNVKPFVTKLLIKQCKNATLNRQSLKKLMINCVGSSRPRTAPWSSRNMRWSKLKPFTARTRKNSRKPASNLMRWWKKSNESKFR